MEMSNKKSIMYIGIGVLILVIILLIVFLGKGNKNDDYIVCNQKNDTEDYFFEEEVMFDKGDIISVFTSTKKYNIKDQSEEKDYINFIKSVYESKYSPADELDYINYSINVSDHSVVIEFNIDCLKFNDEEFNSEIKFGEVGSEELQKQYQDAGYTCKEA